jgi:hypothetical protein
MFQERDDAHRDTHDSARDGEGPSGFTSGRLLTPSSATLGTGADLRDRVRKRGRA